MTFDARLSAMTPEQLLPAIDDMQTLQRHPAWRVLCEVMQESWESADAALHHSRADDQVSIAMAQATCSAIRHLLSLPDELLRRYGDQIDDREHEVEAR